MVGAWAPSVAGGRLKSPGCDRGGRTIRGSCCVSGTTLQHGGWGRYVPIMELNPVDLGDIAATSAALFTLGALIVAIVSARIAVNAKAESKRSADAAEDSAASSKRSADAAEQSAQADATIARLAEEEANRYTIPWRLEHDFKQRYKLIHDDPTETAYDIRVEGEAVHHNNPKTVLGPKETMSFLLVPELNASQDVTVKWRRESDPEGHVRTWTGQP